MSKILYTDLMEYPTDEDAQTAWVTDASVLELDYMEYATVEAAQAAYVSNGGGSYGSDVFTGGTPSASSEHSSFPVAQAFDDNNATAWATWVGLPYGWIKYDLGEGVTKTVEQYTIRARDTATTQAPKDWIFKGSNNDSDWDVLDTVTGETGWGGSELRVFTIINSTAYRYYMVDIIDNNGDTNYTSIAEIEGMELFDLLLQCYPESTIKRQGSYSLKVLATTGALNKTLTKSGLSIDLSGVNTLKYHIYSASRTGSHIKIGIHDTGGTTTEHTANISSMDAWESQTWDISGVDDANKDDIDSIIITIVNADAENIFYVDNFRSLAALQCYSEDTEKQQGSYSLKILATLEALNNTLTKTVTDYLDYSIMDVMKFAIRASRTGENIKLKIHDTGGTTSEYTINIASANEWQIETWDISGITGTNRDTIDKIIIEISNADAENIIYIDNLYSEVIVAAGGETSHPFVG